LPEMTPLACRDEAEVYAGEDSPGTLSADSFVECNGPSENGN
jgi:hypothetical protein